MKFYKLLSDKYSVIQGSVLSEDHFMIDDNFPVSFYVEKYPADWEDVFENQFEPEGFLDRMHKDTDLGHYAGLAMQGLLSNSNSSFIVGTPELISSSISIAKELIKQLDQETK